MAHCEFHINQQQVPPGYVHTYQFAKTDLGFGSKA
ncbi:hypothetical protein FHT77_000458 [Rhizobium sp. BK181]|nr:hypothetical protein [Rhizobium sp. BK181]